METEDPRAALRATDVPTRSAAARDLARIGTWDDIALLVKMANEDKSSAVRLYTAAAAADIAARFRGAAGQGTMSSAQRQQLHDWVKGFDPGANPGLLMLLSAAADQQAIERLGRMMKDPRNGVRAGASTALRRLLVSASAAALPEVAETLAQLSSSKLPPDAVLEVVKLVGELGLPGFEATIKQVAAAGRVAAEAAEETTKRLKQRQTIEGWQGLYVDEGTDVLELREPAGPKRWIAICGETWTNQTGQSDGIRVDAGGARVDGEVVRMVFAPRVGPVEARFAAVQRAGATYWRVEPKDLPSALDEWWPTLSDAHLPVMRAMANWMEPIEGVAAARARAILLWRTGEPAKAFPILDDLVVNKKPRADVYWWLGRVAADLGQKARAAEALDTFLEKSGKKVEWRKEAEELRAKL